MEIFTILKELSKERLVIVVSHDKEHAKKHGDRIIELSDGKVCSDQSKEGNKFVDTKNNHYLKYELEYNKKVNKFSFKSCLELALNFLNYRKIRMLVTIFISTIAFSLFALSFTMVTFNKEKVGLASMINNDVNYVNITRSILGDEYVGMTQKLDDAHLDDLNRKHQSLNFKPVYSPMSTLGIISYSKIIARKGELYQEIIHNPYLPGFYELDLNEIHSMQMSLVSGRLATQDNEIALTKHTFEVFEKFGYVDLSNKIININSYGDLLNKTFRYTVNDMSESFEIVGIVDTNIDYSKYTCIPTDVPLNAAQVKAKKELMDLLYSGYHNLGFVNFGYIERNKMSTYFPSDYFKQENYIDEFGSQRSISSYHLVKKAEELNVVMFGDNEVVEMKTNDVLISNTAYAYSILNEELILREVNGIDFLKSLDRSLLKDLLLINKIYANLTEDWSDTEHLQYATEAYNVIYKDVFSYKTFIYPKGVKTKDEFDFSLLEIILANYLKKPIDVSARNIDISLPELPKKHFNVVGIVFSGRVNQSKVYLNKDTIIDNNLFDEGFYNSVLAYTNFKNKKDIKQLINLDHNTKDGEYYIYNNFVVENLREVEWTLKGIAQTFLYVGLFFTVFAIVLFSNFIITTVNDKKVEIGILRALGARTKDVNKIFFLQSIIIGFFNFILATIVTNIGILIINNVLTKDFGINLTILTFGFLEPLLILTVTLLVSIVSSIIPAYKLASMQPIDAISNSLKL